MILSSRHPSGPHKIAAAATTSTDPSSTLRAVEKGPQSSSRQEVAGSALKSALPSAAATLNVSDRVVTTEWWQVAKTPISAPEQQQTQVASLSHNPEGYDTVETQRGRASRAVAGGQR